jgi:hypothetical protein
MAAKDGKGGRIYNGWLRREDYLVKTLDDRDRTGKNQENVDNTMANHYAGTTDKGERVWSF